MHNALPMEQESTIPDSPTSSKTKKEAKPFLDIQTDDDDDDELYISVKVPTLSQGSAYIGDEKVVQYLREKDGTVLVYVRITPNMRGESFGRAEGC